VSRTASLWQDEVKETIREFLQQDKEYEQFEKDVELKCDLRPLHKALEVCVCVM
jgi:hypothetical protein